MESGEFLIAGALKNPHALKEKIIVLPFTHQLFFAWDPFKGVGYPLSSLGRSYMCLSFCVNLGQDNLVSGAWIWHPEMVVRWGKVLGNSCQICEWKAWEHPRQQQAGTVCGQPRWGWDLLRDSLGLILTALVTVAVSEAQPWCGELGRVHGIL